MKATHTATEIRCGTCGAWKSNTEFQRDKNRASGFKSVCRPCRAAEAVARYANNREKLLAYGALWRARNRERHREMQRAWREKNIEHQRRLEKEWEARNKDRRNSHTRAYVARKRGASGSHTGQDIKDLYFNQQGLCAACSKPLLDKYDVDHRVPLVKGGSNGPDNLQLLCVTCNRSKNDRDWEVFLEERRCRTSRSS